MLKEGEKIITEIALACGFSTLRYFSKCFKEKFGITYSYRLEKQGIEQDNIIYEMSASGQ